MRMKPHHFHLTAALVLGGIAVATYLSGHLVPAGFIAVGALVALVHWKASKLGLTDR